MNKKSGASSQNMLDFSAAGLYNTLCKQLSVFLYQTRRAAFFHIGGII